MSGWIEKLPSGRLRAVYRDAAGDRHRELFDRRQVKAFSSPRLPRLWRAGSGSTARRADPVPRVAGQVVRRG